MNSKLKKCLHETQKEEEQADTIRSCCLKYWFTVTWQEPILHDRLQSSAANKYTFVWKKAVEKNEKKLDEKLKVFLKDVEEITRKENQIYGDKDFAETGDDTPVTSEEIKAVADQINRKLAEINDLDDEDSKDVKKTEESKTPDWKGLSSEKRKYEKMKSQES